MRVKRHQEGEKTALEKALEVKPPSFTRPNPFVKKKGRTLRPSSDEREKMLKERMSEKVKEYQTNSNKMKGESDAQYNVRYGRMKEERKRKISPLRRKTEELQEKREKLPYVQKMAAEIVMSPLDIAESLTDKMDLLNTEKYKSDKDKRQDIINLADSVLDSATLMSGGAVTSGGAVIKKAVKKTVGFLFKKYGGKVLKEVLGEEVFNQLTKLNQST